MDAVWAAVIAGIGGSLITGGVAIRVAANQRRADRDGHRANDRRAAYSQLVSTSGLLLHSAGMLHLAMETRSGVTEGIDVALRLKKPVDVFELYNFLRQDTEPLYHAWSMVWTVGSADGIRIANDLIDAATEVMGAATTRGQGRSGLARFVAGEKWTPDQLATWQGHTRRLAELRRELAELARKELGHEVAQLWTSSSSEART